MKVKVKEMNFNLEHQKEQRRILGQDMVIFCGHNSLRYEELDDSLILVHQNIRDLSSKISEFTILLTLDNINPQSLCFSEHHMSESNLCLINIENYNLGSCFCCQTYQKGGFCVYVRKDIYYKSLDLIRYCEEKSLGICAVQIESVTNQQIIVCVYTDLHLKIFISY